jgi:uncharacterized protein with GYD domain
VLVHMTHVHKADVCPAHKPETMQMLGNILKSAEEKGVHVHSLYVAPWEHTFYGVLEADSAESLERFLDPLLELGTARITPVEEASLAAFEQRLGSMT